MKLDVWMDGVASRVGVLERAADKSMTFSYADGVPANGRVSIAMPIRTDPYGDAACVAYFGNLLFEGRELERVKAAHRIDGDDIAGLLYHLGADCPGAVSVTPEGAGPGKRPGLFPDDYEHVSKGRMIEIVRSLHYKGHLPEGARDPSPVAGVQPKIALLRMDGEFYLPRAGSRAPTTHILKISPKDDLSITRHEHALLSLARSIEIKAIESEYLVFEDDETCAEIGAILSERFDRIVEGNEIRRIHAEDLCQALGLSRHLKYERDGELDEHKFSLKAVGDLADCLSIPVVFQVGFLMQTIFNLAVGNTDNHAKNTSILYRTENGELAPLYDVVPVTMDSRPTHALSFSLGNATFAEDLSEEALTEAMKDLGFKKPKALKLILLVLRQVAKRVNQMEAQGGKLLADGVAAQLLVLEEVLGVDLKLPDRDFFPRNVRDEKAVTMGWGGVS